MYFNLSVDVRKSCKASVQTRFKQIKLTLQPKLTCVLIIIHMAQRHDAYNITEVHKSLKVNILVFFFFIKKRSLFFLRNLKIMSIIIWTMTN